MMKIPFGLKYISISTRISILLGVVILVTMGVFSTISLIRQQHDSVDALNRSTLLLGQTTEKILRLSMIKNKRDDISAAIRDIVGSEGIRSVRILNHEGIIKFSSRRSELEQHISRANRLCANCHTGGDTGAVHTVSRFYSHHLDERNGIVYSSLPIYNSPSCYNSDCHITASAEARSNNGRPAAAQIVHHVHSSSETILGFIEIEVSAKRIMANLARTRSQLIILTIVIAVAASAITYFSIRYLVGKPVRRLVDGMRRVAQGDFSREIPSGRAELGFLADSFNQMQRQLLSTQSQLIESEKLASVGKLADGIANEISNPLTGIIIYTESLIAKSKLGDSERAECDIILREAMKTRESVRNILSLTRKDKPEFRTVDIVPTVRHAITVVEKLPNFRNIRITTSMQRDLPHVSIDPGMMEQVFLNLLMIFSENMPEGGILNISSLLVEKDRKIEIRFADAGKTIPDNLLQAIAEQIEYRDSEKIGRTEISLSVCKDILALHRGKIRAGAGAEAEASIIVELAV